MQRVCSRSEGQWLETSHQPTSCGIPRPIRGELVNQTPAHKLSDTLVPDLDERTRSRIISAGKKVTDARELYPERSLAEQYDALSMEPDLVKAHNALDREVDRAFGASRKLTNERQRQELLFANYIELTTGR
ncbi:type IIL restriction-modification enzyme MmeI [Corynebacterium sp. LK2510]|uniref:type IIL restriction-modification enzyme MmeI n=1 Tax=Corynebacterium sp. LK2510 TaxID=3110472 RepID=UPI0034CDAB07